MTRKQMEHQSVDHAKKKLCFVKNKIVMTSWIIVFCIYSSWFYPFKCVYLNNLKSTFILITGINLLDENILFYYASQNEACIV